MRWLTGPLAVGVVAILVIAATADGASKHKCTPNVSTTKKAHQRAQHGWDSEKVKKRPKVIARVRLQSRCVPDGAPAEFVKERIAEARKEYRKAKKKEKIKTIYRKITSAPGQVRLAVLRQCESTNRYNSPAAPAGAYGMLQGWALSGTYFSSEKLPRKWQRLTGDGPTSPPYMASPDEQDIRASLLYQHHGTSPWACPF